MKLTENNYFDLEMQRAYMSTSQFKSFQKCSAQVVAELNGDYQRESKDAFIEGHMFEALVSGDEELFYMQHPEIISSQGKTKGNVKANFKKVLESVESFQRQTAFAKIIARCNKQVLVKGVINGVPYKALLDLYDPLTGEIFDTKCMRDFEDAYSPEEGRRIPWWQHWGYHYQGAIYCELVRQTFGTAPTFTLLAATKEPVPDVAWIQFDPEYLRNVLDIVEEMSPTYQMMKDDFIESERCETCAYCKSTKILKSPELIETGEVFDD